MTRWWGRKDLGGSPGPSDFPSVPGATRSRSLEASFFMILPGFSNAHSHPGHGKPSMTEILLLETGSGVCDRKGDGEVWQPPPVLVYEAQASGGPTSNPACPVSASLIQTHPAASRDRSPPVLSSLQVTSGCPGQGRGPQGNHFSSLQGLRSSGGVCVSGSMCVCTHVCACACVCQCVTVQ